MSSRLLTLSLGPVLLAGLAAAQIRTVVPYTPPKASNSDQDQKTTRKAANKAKPVASRSRAKKTAAIQTAQSSAAATQPAQQPYQAAQVHVGPGDKLDADGTRRACDENDPTPNGTVVDGYQKVARPNVVQPHHCEWEAVKQ